MINDTAIAQVVERGGWASPASLINWSKGKQDKMVADNNHISQDKSSLATRAAPIVVEGKKVSFYYNDMVPNCAYRALVAGKPHMFIKDEAGAIDIYVVR
ncbi:hypothetical protein ACFLUX_01050 [Chloroflexota bacterium]